MKKTLITIVVTVLACFCVVGTTLAFLVDETDPIINTFTVGNVDITLTESNNLDLKMIPGKTIAQDPKVSVAVDSEDCYVFVKIDESANLDTFITYAVADGWTALGGQSGVYYRVVDTGDTVRSFSVLSGDAVTVKDSVTKDNMDDLNKPEAVKPTLTFTAYAVQKDNVGAAGNTDAQNAAAAWAIAIANS